jgi:hypothetical protein
VSYDSPSCHNSVCYITSTTNTCRKVNKQEYFYRMSYLRPCSESVLAYFQQQQVTHTGKITADPHLYIGADLKTVESPCNSRIAPMRTKLRSIPVLLLHGDSTVSVGGQCCVRNYSASLFCCYTVIRRSSQSGRIRIMRSFSPCYLSVHRYGCSASFSTTDH